MTVESGWNAECAEVGCDPLGGGDGARGGIPRVCAHGRASVFMVCPPCGSGAGDAPDALDDLGDVGRVTVERLVDAESFHERIQQSRGQWVEVRL